MYIPQKVCYDFTQIEQYMCTTVLNAKNDIFIF